VAKPKIPSGSPRAKFAQAVSRIFQTKDGQVLASYLREVTNSLSCFGADGNMYDDRRTMFQEGQRQMAIMILGAEIDSKNIEGE
jgi:hypothetical protein